MIFSQAQKQGLLLLIGMVLAGYGFFALFEEKPKPVSQKVMPLLLERPARKAKKKTAQNRDFSPSRVSNQFKKKKKTYPKSNFKQKPKPPLGSVNLNTADSAKLDDIPGIGAKTALRILKYKSLIGQFVEVDQLQQVYGISAENYERMSPYFKIERVGELLKKDLNAEKTYKIAWIIGKEKAALLTDKRREEGWFQSWDQLASFNILSERELKWLEAYFDIGESSQP